LPRLHGTIILFLLSLIFTGQAVFSETYFAEKRYSTDSLQRVLLTATGPERIRTLCILAGQYRIDEAEKSIAFAEEAFELSRVSSDPELKLLATYSIGQAYHHAGDFAKAILYGLDARDLALKLHDTAMYYRNAHIIGLSYLYSNNPDLFINTVWEVKRYLQNWKDPARQFELQIRIGWAYMMTGKYREALLYYHKATACADSTTLVIPVKIALNYSHIVRCYMNITEYDSAKYFIDLCEKICHEHGFDFTEYAYRYLSEYYFAKGYYDSALLVCKVIVDTSRIKGDFFFQASKLSEMGKIYRLQDRPDLAIAIFLELIEKAEWIRENKVCCIDRDKNFDQYFTPEQSVPDWEERGALRYLILGHSNLYEINKSLGDFRKALVHLEAHNEALNRVRELDRKKDVMEVNTRYETERKEQRILLLTNENEINTLKIEQTRYLMFILAGFILLAAMAVIMFIRQNRMKTMQEKAVLEQKLLRAQMNPHFLFNTLTNIQGYMIENDIKKASHYLSRFAKLMRNILHNTTQEWIPLEEEINTIENYLELQKSRYQDMFDYILEVDKRIDKEETSIPPMLAQPFIENAIEHGIRHLKGRGNITISFKLFGDKRSSSRTVLKSYSPKVLTLISVEITDNGVGREKSAEIENNAQRNHRPMATSITRERLKVISLRISRRLSRHITLDIIDLYDDAGNACGTKVKLVILAEKR
jgi:tetratricopeptide (TPR) repeat protein